MRIDKLLYCLRFARSRSAAQRWIGEGHIRRNGARVVRQDQPIAVGDVLTLPLRSKVLPIEILALPVRRGPGSEARNCYRPLDAVGAIAIAGEQDAPQKGAAHP
ncbi:S4 domain-containing protein [Croceibacterium aestuarii]|uniref:S4 domain-containing protein n=1 Tax=Croceibacterium aestuarii TaxID=3064139 RepID=UPI00272DF678|nr:S4 domain-containing protein [Croceibacterium sp. D39]